MKKNRKNIRKKIELNVFVCESYLIAHKDLKYKLERAIQKELDFKVSNYFAKKSAKIKRESIFKKLIGKLTWKRKK